MLIMNTNILLTIYCLPKCVWLLHLTSKIHIKLYIFYYWNIETVFIRINILCYSKCIFYIISLAYLCCSSCNIFNTILQRNHNGKVVENLMLKEEIPLKTHYYKKKINLLESILFFFLKENSNKKNRWMQLYL